ncbi:hypothetical protein [Burkholderia contaminans]|uniref:hypothetical protein n=1 Tax=Burkholderia contaminans TaxID=488447 RepID=UPI00158E4C01|nr:hypothetical protein [Burkholderia contaminans]
MSGFLVSPQPEQRVAAAAPRADIVAVAHQQPVAALPQLVAQMQQVERDTTHEQQLHLVRHPRERFVETRQHFGLIGRTAL